MKYVKTDFFEPLRINDIVSAHYFEYKKDFAFSGELHDFWEFVYVDKGEFFITADAEEFLLRQGEMYIHKPLEFHNVRMNGKVASNSVIFSFSSDCTELFCIAGKIIACGSKEREIMAVMIEEAKNAYSTPLGDPYTYKLERRKNQKFASEQLIKIYLEMLLIGLIRNTDEKSTVHISKPSVQKNIDARCKEICDFLEANTESRITFEKLCDEFSLSASALKKMFREKFGCGVMYFFQKCKIERAKELIREGTLNFSEISEMLCYSSIHYFSRRFKEITDMTPSQYAASIESYYMN